MAKHNIDECDAKEDREAEAKGEAEGDGADATVADQEDDLPGAELSTETWQVLVFSSYFHRPLWSACLHATLVIRRRFCVDGYVFVWCV